MVYAGNPLRSSSASRWRTGRIIRLEEGEGVGRREGVGQIAEVDRRDELFGRHVGEKLPQRLSFHLSPKVPQRVDDGGRGEVDDAFLGADPAELAIAGESSPAGGEVLRDAVEAGALERAAEQLGGGNHQLGAAATCEGETVALEPGLIGAEDDVGGRVVGIDMHGVGAVERLRRREADIEDLEVLEEDGGHAEEGKGAGDWGDPCCFLLIRHGALLLFAEAFDAEADGLAGRRNVGGFIPMPTPDGVPVEMMSPG